MIFRATNSSSFLFNPIYPVFLTRKYLGTPLSLDRRNLIFRVKVVESASLNLTLNSALTELNTESSTNNITLRSANVIPLYTPATLYSSLNGVFIPSSIGDTVRAEIIPESRLGIVELRQLEVGNADDSHQENKQSA